MKYTINIVIDFLQGEKETWQDKYRYMKIEFGDVSCDKRHKASQWLKFEDGSGELKIYEEDSTPHFDDLEIGETARDLALGGVALFVPIVGPWVAAGIIGLRGGQLISTELSWKNTFIFLFESLENKCVFAIKIHHPKRKSASHILEDIKEVVLYQERKRS